jgi:hypothetical protein
VGSDTIASSITATLRGLIVTAFRRMFAGAGQVHSVEERIPDVVSE